MNRIVIVVVIVAGALWPLERALAHAPKSSSSAMPPHRVELSYALGYEAGLDLGQREPDVDIATVLQGVADGYSHKKPAYPPQRMRQVIEAMKQSLMARARAMYTKRAATNLKQAEAFFAANKRKQGVVTLPSGVQYKVLRGGDGSGKSPTLHSRVTLQYQGAFLDGTVFDNTKDRGKPVVFPVSQMIPGWRHIITRMHVGDHWQVFIPPDEAYGFRGQPPRIGPNQALVFDIRLLKVKP
jgi:FKBP-type peptidyl-prolyl cis-trans isomerase